MNESMKLQPRRALRAVAALSRNPDDTAQVFTIIESLTGRAGLRIARRFAKDSSGAHLLHGKKSILPTLLDRERLKQYGPGTLAAAYLEFITSEKIGADGLVEASREGEARNEPLSSDRQYVHERLRDTHDLWHALLGYRGDVLGEAAILAFTLAQTGNPGIALIVAVFLWKAQRSEARQLIIDAFHRGLEAAWLPAQDWEALLPLPIDEVRSRLRVGTPPEYTPVRTADLRAQGMAA
jgi:ubiquinone biosynthesis protein COQ4